LPISMIAILAAAGIFAGTRSGTDLPPPPAKAPEAKLQTTHPGPASMPSEPPPPSLDVLTQKAQLKSFPPPPTIGKASEVEVKDYIAKLRPYAEDPDAETAKLARDLARRLQHDLARQKGEDHKKEMDAKREQKAKERADQRAAQEALHPPPPKKPRTEAPPPSPLQGPPVKDVVEPVPPEK